MLNSYVEGGGALDEGAKHIFLPTSSFLSLSLLFNIALEECALDQDYTPAIMLLHLSEKIYNLPGTESVYVSSNNNTSSSISISSQHTNNPPSRVGSTSFPPLSSTSSPLDREYLRAVLKRQKIFRDAVFWREMFRQEIKQRVEDVEREREKNMQAHESMNPSPLSSSSSSSSSYNSSREDRESFVFELLCGLLQLQLSLSVPQDLVSGVVSAFSQDYGLHIEKRATLAKLIISVAQAEREREREGIMRASNRAQENAMGVNNARRGNIHSPGAAQRRTGTGSGFIHTPLTPTSMQLQYPGAHD